MSEIEAPEEHAKAVERTKLAFAEGGVITDALLAWVDYSTHVCGLKDNTPGMVFAYHWASHIRQAVQHGSRSSIRAFFQFYEGKQIETLQVHKDGKVWAPPARLVTQVRPTFVQIGDSRRYYRQATFLTRAPGVLIIRTEDAVCAYRMVLTEPEA